MDLFPFLLVVVSAFTHAIWNFIVKKSADQTTCVALSKIAEVILFFIPFVILCTIRGIPIRFGYFILIGSFFVTLNYVFLSQAYKRIDLTIAYPISRSNTLFLPLVAFLMIRETVGIMGWLAVLLIILGVFLLFSDDFFKRSMSRTYGMGILFALSAALMTACYTVWDKMAIRHLHPFIYFYSYTFLTSVYFLTRLLPRSTCQEMKEEWNANKRNVILVAVLNTLTYLLVLIALGLSKSIYVGMLRQMSLVFTLFLGCIFLKEKLKVSKLAGILCILLGSTLTLLSD